MLAGPRSRQLEMREPYIKLNIRGAAKGYAHERVGDISLRTELCRPARQVRCIQVTTQAGKYLTVFDSVSRGVAHCQSL
jgi:hypothetical protein